MGNIPIVVICGPTASGKTSLSVELAREFSGEIVSADSMQIYKYMDIGSAKPNTNERGGVVHHMMDIIEPSESFSVKQYQDMAHAAIKDICDRGKLPVMVGGTGLYINSVINDVDFTEEKSDPHLRRELEAFADENGADALYGMLRELDEPACDIIHKNNIRRVIRAIEFIKLNNKKFSLHVEDGKKKISRYRPLMLDIAWDRDVLYDRINKRVDIMFSLGLTDEVKRLVQMGVDIHTTAMQGIGYKEVLGIISGEKTEDEVKEEIKLSSRRYAKRQLTWFRRDDRIIHLSPTDALSQAKRYVADFLREG